MARKLAVEIIGDSRSLERAFKRSGTSGKTFERQVLGMSKRAALALGGLGLAGAGLGAKFTKMAGDAEEVRSKFQTVFGGEMTRMVRQLDTFSKATGASRYELRQQTADLGALLVPLIGTRKEAANLSVGFTKLATDLSSFNNVPVEEALLAIRSGLVGEAEPLRRFGVLLNEAAVKAEAYRAGIAKAGAELTEQQKVQARANLIMQQTKLAQGDATRTADSFTNQLRRLKNQASDTATDLGMKLLPVATKILEALNKWGPVIADRIQPHLDRLAEWARQHQTEFRDLFRDATEAGKTFAGVLEDIVVGADKVAKKMGGWDDAFKLILAGTLATKFGGLLTKLQGADGKGGIAGALTRIKGLGPTIGIAIGIDLLISDEDKGLIGWLESRTGNKGIFSTSLLDLWKGTGGVNVPGIGNIGGSGSRDPMGERGGPSMAPGGGVQLGTSQDTTHQTRGMGGFPAKDWFATPGTPVLAPEAGVVVRHSGRGGTSGQVYGWSLYFVGTATGNTYFVTHLAEKRAPVGARLKKGDVLGYISAWAGGAPHAHVGIKKGSGQGTTPTPLPTPSPAGGGGGGGTTRGGEPPLIPGKMRLALARAEGTKRIGDDITALQAMVAYLQKLLPKTKDIEKRIEITEALNGLRERIRELGKTGKGDISDAIDYEKLKQKLREQFREGLRRAQDAVKDARSGFRAAFEGLGETMLRVFDAKTEQLLANARATVAQFGFSIGAGEETPTERLLRQRREEQEDERLRQNLAEAKTEAERNDALLAIEDRRLEKQAAAERDAADTALETERNRIEAERALKRDAFNKDLAALQAQWTRTNATNQQRTAELQKLMASYEMPFADVGTLLGQSFANGFLDEIQIVFDRLNDLARAMSHVTPAQAAEAAIMAGGSALAARSAALNALYGLNVPHFQTGGIVPGSGPQLAVVHGGETIIPKHRSAGGPDTIIVQLGDTTLARLVRNAKGKFEQQNGAGSF